MSFFFFSACNLRNKRKWRNNIFELESASSAERIVCKLTCFYGL